MNVLLIPTSENLVEKIADELAGIEGDYSSNLVVFPGKRPSHFLRKALAEKERSSFLPPCVFSIDEFIDHIHDVSFELHGRKLEPIDAVSILYDLHTASPGHLGRIHFLAPDTFFPVGLKLYKDIEELYIEQIPFQKVKEIDTVAGENIPEAAAERLQSFSYFYGAFYKEIEEGRFSTRSTRYRAVSERIDRLNLDRFEKVIFAGFFALTNSEKEIFRSLLQRESTLFIFQEGEGMKKKLAELGMTMNMSFAKSDPEILCYKSPDSHGQVLGVSSLLKKRMEQKEPIDEKTVIVLPSSETLLPLFHQALSLLQPESYNISLGYPLQRTPLFGFFNNLMEAILTMDGDRLYIPYYLEFILHPYTKNIYFEGRADITRILFHAIEETLLEKGSKKFLSLSELESGEMFDEAIKEKVLANEPEITLKRMHDHLETIHANTIRKMFSFNDVEDFAKKANEVIRYIYENSTARLHPFFYPYSEAFVTHLDILSRSLMKGVRFQEAGSYFSLFKKYIMTAYTPFAGTPLRGVQVLGFLETRNLKFEKVIFLDANEGVLPDTTREDSFLPFKARQALGLPTYLDREEIMFYTFDTLVRGAEESHLFFVENNEKERSRFVETFLWEKQKREGTRDDKKYVKTIQYAVSLGKGEPRPIEKSEEMIRFLKDYRFSATSLNTYLRCPLQFYYEYLLGLREREAVSEEFESKEIGTFVHTVLQDYFKGKIGSALTEKDMNLKELEGVIRYHFEREYGKDPTGEFYLLRKQIERHLKDFIKDYQLPKIKEFPTKILSLEQKIDITIDSFKLGARLDRVEKRGDRTVIIDYKTSANKNNLAIRYNRLEPDNRESWAEGIGSLQLPFYRITYAALTGEEPEKIDCLFLLLGKARIDASIEVPLFSSLEEDSGNKEKWEGLRFVLFSLLKEIIDPQIEFQPATALKNRCDDCRYKHICTN